MSEPSPNLPSPHEVKHVPPELIDDLHKANEALHHAREKLEAEMDSSEYRHQERVNEAAAEFDQAEKEVESIDDHIRDSEKSP